MWLRVDDKFPDHPKVRGLDATALAVWLCAACWSAEYEQNGKLPLQVARQLAARFDPQESLLTGEPPVVSQLVAVGLWERTDIGYMVHDFLEYNPSKSDLDKRRKRERSRRRKGYRDKVSAYRRVARNVSPTTPHVASTRPDPTRTRPVPVVKDRSVGAHPPFPPSHAQPQDLADLWNAVLIKPRVLELRGTRLIHTRAQLREHPELDWWRQVLERVVATPFLRGAGRQQWVASFDWLVANPTNAVAVLEGKYDEAPLARPRDRPSVPLAIRAAEIAANVGRVHRDAGDVRQDQHAHRAVPVLPVHAGGTADVVDAPGTVGGRDRDAGDG